MKSKKPLRELGSAELLIGCVLLFLCLVCLVCIFVLNSFMDTASPWRIYVFVVFVVVLVVLCIFDVVMESGNTDSEDPKSANRSTENADLTKIECAKSKSDSVSERDFSPSPSGNSRPPDFSSTAVIAHLREEISRQLRDYESGSSDEQKSQKTVPSTPSKPTAPSLHKSVSEKDSDFYTKLNACELSDRLGFLKTVTEYGDIRYADYNRVERWRTYPTDRLFVICRLKSDHKKARLYPLSNLQPELNLAGLDDAFGLAARSRFSIFEPATLTKNSYNDNFTVSTKGRIG